MQKLSNRLKMLNRFTVATAVAGVVCLIAIPLTGVLVKGRASADFLNPDSSYILPPTNVGMTADWTSGHNQSTLQWTPSANAVGYSVYMNDIQIARGIGGHSYQLDPQTFNENATYAVTSTDQKGAESIPSNIVDAHYVFDPANLPGWVSGNAPGVPTKVFATPQWNLGAPRIFLSWNGIGTTYYRVYRDGLLVADGLFDLTYIDSDVTAGSTHTYQVSSVASFDPRHPEGVRSDQVVATAPNSQIQFSATPITVTKVVPDDDSAQVFFSPVPGATDYRVYNLANQTSAKYAGQLLDDYQDDWAGQHAAPYSIEMNGLSTSGADLIVEAVDKYGPFQKADGFAGPGATLGTSVNGQGDPSNVPNVVARSKVFHVTPHPFQLTGSQAFSDTFRNEQPLQKSTVDPAIPAFYGAGSDSNFSGEKNDKWTFTSYEADKLMTRNFFMGGHFMDTMYDGPDYTTPFSHNNNATNVMEPNATANIAGGKVLHVTMEVDAHNGGSRWTDILVGRAGDPLLDPEAPGKLSIGNNPLPTSSGDLFYWGILSGAPDLVLYQPDPSSPGHSKQTDLLQLATGDGYFNDFVANDRNPGSVAVPGMNGSPQDLDKRHRFDLYLSAGHYKVVETTADGLQMVRERDFPSGVTFPVTDAQVYYAHELYHTGRQQPDDVNYSGQGNSDPLGASAQYWYNYRPYSDERHWDNMGFEVLPSLASIPPTASLIPESEAPDYVGVTSTPTPSPALTPTPTLSPPVIFDLDSDGRVTLFDIILAVQAYNGSPNAAALRIWPPKGDPEIAGIVQVIRQFNGFN